MINPIFRFDFYLKMAGFAAIAALSLHILFAVTFSGLHIAVFPAEFKRMSKKYKHI
jgi:hypothetical protein